MPNFLGLKDAESNYGDSAAVIVPVPYERTVSWGAGTARGPAAILTASDYVELHDEILNEQPYRKGIHTAPPVAVDQPDIEAFLADLEATAAGLFRDDKFPVFLGGEHGLTIGPVRAAHAAFDDLTVLQLDAHADLRDSYHGTRWSHACVMRRVIELGVPVVSIGVRGVSPEEAELIHANDIPVFWSHRIAHSDEWMETAITMLSDNVYLTFDVDFFDPAVMPSTGTPEPGGGNWHDAMRFLAKVFVSRRVVGMDVVELAPIDGLHAPDFVAARLVYRAIGYRFHDWGGRGGIVTPGPA
jgi:agmatinase